MWFDRCRVLCIHPRFSQIIADESSITPRIRTGGRRGQGRRAALSYAARLPYQFSRPTCWLALVFFRACWLGLGDANSFVELGIKVKTSRVSIAECV